MLSSIVASDDTGSTYTVLTGYPGNSTCAPGAPSSFLCLAGGTLRGLADGSRAEESECCVAVSEVHMRCTVHQQVGFLLYPDPLTFFSFSFFFSFPFGFCFVLFLCLFCKKKIYKCICLCLFLYISRSLSLFLCLCLCLSVCLSLCLSLFQSHSVCLSLSLCVSLLIIFVCGIVVFICVCSIARTGC